MDNEKHIFSGIRDLHDRERPESAMAELVGLVCAEAMRQFPDGVVKTTVTASYDSAPRQVWARIDFTPARFDRE